MNTKHCLILAGIFNLLLTLAVSSDLRAAPQEPRLEKKLAAPSLGGSEYVQYPGWVGYEGGGRYVGIAYRLKDHARLAVWETRTDRLVLDDKIDYLNRDNDFGLQTAFHPAGSHVLTMGHLRVEGLPVGAANNRLLAWTPEASTTDRRASQQLGSTISVGERSVKIVTAYRGNTLYVDSVSPDEMRMDPDNPSKTKSFKEEKKFVLDGSPAHLAMDAGQTQIVWDQRGKEPESPDRIHLLDLSTGKSRTLASAKPIMPISCLAFSLVGDAVLSGGRDGFIRMWSVKDAKEQFCVAVNEWTISSVAFSPDGMLIAAGSLKAKESNLMLFSAKTGKAAWIGQLDVGSVIAVAFSPSGDKLAVLGSPGGLYIYDIKEFRKSVNKD